MPLITRSWSWISLLPERYFVISLFRGIYPVYTATMPQLHQWAEGWAENRTSFHKASIHEALQQFQDKLLVKKPSRVLVPLCGKTIDMKWLANEGHEVVGVEGVSKAVREFFQEQDLAYTESDVPGLDGAKLCQTEDGKIKIYKCDFFQFSKDIAGQFDAIWDRGSLVAIDPCERQKYSDLIVSVLTPGGRILSEVFLYDTEEWTVKGPPNTVPDEALKELYGERFTIELLADNDHLEKAPKFRYRGLTWMRQHVHIMTLK